MYLLVDCFQIWFLLDAYYSYQTVDGIQVSDRGYLKSGENGTYYLVREGSYEYPEVNGTIRSVKFLADQNGFNILN